MARTKTTARRVEHDGKRRRIDVPEEGGGGGGGEGGGRGHEGGGGGGRGGGGGGGGEEEKKRRRAEGVTQREEEIKELEEKYFSNGEDVRAWLGMGTEDLTRHLDECFRELDEQGREGLRKSSLLRSEWERKLQEVNLDRALLQEREGDLLRERGELQVQLMEQKAELGTCQEILSLQQVQKSKARSELAEATKTLNFYFRERNILMNYVREQGGNLEEILQRVIPRR